MKKLWPFEDYNIDIVSTQGRHHGFLVKSLRATLCWHGTHIHSTFIFHSFLPNSSMVLKSDLEYPAARPNVCLRSLLLPNHLSGSDPNFKAPNQCCPPPKALWDHKAVLKGYPEYKETRHGACLRSWSYQTGFLIQFFGTYGIFA